MSRLIVKNLPTRTSEDKLRQAFSARGGNITDVQLKFTKDGVFRQFGFVGFQSEEDARAAREYLNGTYLGASKISVEVCADLGSADKPRSWSKYSADSSRSVKNVSADVDDVAEKAKQKKKKKSETREAKEDLLERYKDDPKFQEFLRVHKRNFVGTWSEEAILNVGREYEQGQLQQSPNERQEDEADGDGADVSQEDVAKDVTLSDLDYLKSKTVKKTKKEPKKENYVTFKLSGLPYKTTKKDLKTFLKPLKAKSIRIPVKIKGIAYVGFATEKEGNQMLKKNKSFMSGHQVIVRRHKSKLEAHQNVEEKWKQQEEALKNEESVAESGRIFVRNLSYSVSESDIENLFRNYGPITEVNVPVDKVTRKVKGFAFVTFMIPEHGLRAFSELDGTAFQGRLLHLLPGKGKVGESNEDFDEDAEGMSFKKKKALKEKAAAGSSHNWNTLFLGASAVADVMADRYNVDKSDVVLNSGGKQSAAVRLALGETQIVNETKQFLEDQGLVLDAFNQQAKARSSTVILVKNLPSRTKVEEIRDAFAKHGQLGRVLLPPHGISAVVEFLEPSEAKKAFRSLAYTKFHNTPLYLEWAPENAFQTKPSKQEDEGKGADKGPGLATPGSDAIEPEQTVTLFVKNLNFETTEDNLREHFETHVGGVHSVTVAKKKDVKKPGQLLSMGYGFVHFSSASYADKALKTMQLKMLDGHCLELKRSNRAAVAATGARGSTARKTSDPSKLTFEGGTKLIVRNIPFEAKEKEVRDLFRTFGNVKSVRLPKKVTGSHRGFAFVEFADKAEAKKAFEALCQSTHLYGRRLVLEWAEEDETIESLRKKTALQFFEGTSTTRKRPKKSEVMESVKMAKTS